jgi:hypothetical protein
MNTALRYALFITSFVGTMFCGASAAASVSCSLPAILFGIAGAGFVFVCVYYIFVHDEVENTK